VVVGGKQIAFVFDDDSVAATFGGPADVYDNAGGCCEYVEGAAKVGASVEGTFFGDGVDAPSVC
jgi:hypothetical protein